MKTQDEIRQFLRKWYKYDRLEGRGNDYAEAVVISTMEDLERLGNTLISRHESVTGEAIFFDKDLNIYKGESAKRLIKNQ